ncbi:MAG: sodium:solute symporter [Saprospiraceae bacterium]
MNPISNIDIGIIFAYFAFVMGIGFYVSRKTKTSEDLFLGGRTFTYGLIGLSLFASNISSATLVGLSGAAYSTGVVQSVYEWLSGIPLIIAAVVFVPLYLRSKITTIPEFLEKRFDRRSQVFFSVMTIASSVLIEMAGGLYAGSIVLQTFFPDLVLWQTCLGLAIVAGVYTAFGGLKAVVITDAVQSIILIIGCTVLTWVLFGKLDYSWEKVVASAPEGHFSMIRPLDDESMPWSGLFLGVPILGFWYWTTNQYIIQRVLGAQDIKHARWGMILAGFLKVIPLFVMVIPGAMAISLFPVDQFPELAENTNKVFPTIVTQALPVGMVGIVLAGLISAIMSSVDSTLNSASTLVVVDFVKPNNPNLTEKDTVKYGRITTVVLMLIAAFWAPNIDHFQDLWSYLQKMFSILVPPIAVIFLVGVFYKRGNADGSFWTLVIGTILGALLFLVTDTAPWEAMMGEGTEKIINLHYTSNVGIMTALSAVIFVVISKMTPAPDPAQVELLTFRRELLNDGMGGLPWYKDYRFHMVLLVILMTVIMIYFW